MASAKKCDRCGGFYVTNAITKKYVVDTYKDHTWYVLDLCDSCYKELKKFVGVDDEEEETDGTAD